MERISRLVGGRHSRSVPLASRAAGVLLGALLGLGSASCIGSLDHPELFADAGGGNDTPMPPTDGGGGHTCAMAGYNVERDLFPRSCNTPGCHDSTAAQGLNLSVTNPGARLVGAHATTPGCTSALLIDPSNVAQSFLITKVVGPPSTCGSRMPLGGNPLTQAELDCLYAWVEGLVGTRPAPDAGTGGDASMADR